MSVCTINDPSKRKTRCSATRDAMFSSKLRRAQKFVADLRALKGGVGRSTTAHLFYDGAVREPDPSRVRSAVLKVCVVRQLPRTCPAAVAEMRLEEVPHRPKYCQWCCPHDVCHCHSFDPDIPNTRCPMTGGSCPYSTPTSGFSHERQQRLRSPFNDRRRVESNMTAELEVAAFAHQLDSPAGPDGILSHVLHPAGHANVRLCTELESEQPDPWTLSGDRPLKQRVP